MTPRRIVSAFVLPPAILAVIVLPAALLRDRLPETLATHWSGSGPDGSTNGVVFVGAVVAIWLAAWASLVVGARRAERQFHAPWVLGLGGFLAGIVSLTVVANLDAAAWSAADDLPLAAAFAPIAAGLLLAGAGVLLERSAPVTVGVGAMTAARSTTALRPDERFYWSGSAHAAWWFPVVVSATGIAVAASAFLTGAPTALLLAIGVVLPVLALWTSRTRLTVTPAGVHAHMGARFPRRAVSVAAIDGAEAIDVVPLRWGGWGWRITPKATALIVRRGEGVRLRLTTGRDLVVTVDDATTAASLINDLRGRATG
ncbi:MAG: hypothetical protein ITG02_10815 [Patulibacter sp.]|nr:hypothetical protein [Patulibacter sp.]